MTIKQFRDLFFSHVGITQESITLINDNFVITQAFEDDANILDDLGADSLEVVEMLMTLESEFGIIVPDEDVMELKTVRAVADYIESHT